MKDTVVYTENKTDVYNQLISEDDNELSIEGHPHRSHPETRQKVVNGPSSQTYKLITVILGILCAVLLSVIIALCISYKGLSEKSIVLSQNSSDANSNLEQLKANYDLLTESLMKVQKNFQDAVGAKDIMQIERDTERQRTELLRRQKDALITEDANLQTHITTLEESCARCPVGWRLLEPSCYFFTGGQLSWRRSREECKKSKADLAVIDSQEKQEFISRILNEKGPSSRPWHITGYWIGLHDVDTEGVWRWLNGTELTTGFWFDGEPNDEYSIEDCAATYPKENPLKTWNDAPCDFKLQSICEIKLQEHLTSLHIV